MDRTEPAPAGDGRLAVSADGVLTPPLSAESSLQELIEAELRTRRAGDPHQDDEEDEGAEEEEEEEGQYEDEDAVSPMVVAANLKPSRFVTEQPESILLVPGQDGGGPADATADSSRSESPGPAPEPAMPETCIDDEPEPAANAEPRPGPAEDEAAPAGAGPAKAGAAGRRGSDASSDRDGAEEPADVPEVADAGTAPDDAAAADVGEDEAVERRSPRRESTGESPESGADDGEAPRAASPEERGVPDDLQDDLEGERGGDVDQSPAVEEAPYVADQDKPTPDVTSPTSEDAIEVPGTSKVSDEDSDEGVGDGADRRRADGKDGKKLRRKKKSDASTKDSSRVGSGPPRPPLDSEGDSDISSEGSSGASSLTRSQDSGAAAGRARLSESSEPDNEDELANVNLRQLRSSYLTNFDSSKSNTRMAQKLDTGVSIKNLKNTYSAGPAAAARGGPAADARPRDMSKITVNMASLKSVYSAPTERHRPASSQKAADLPAGLSLPSIRAAYVQQAQGQTGPAADRPVRTIKTGVSIDKLDETALTPQTTLTKNRFKSEGDLTQASLPHRLSAGPAAAAERGLRDSEVFSRVSVKALRASFCDLTQLRQPAPLFPRRDPTKPDVGAAAALRSSFGKDESTDHTRIHVRSFDSSKAMRRFSKDPTETASSECRSCGRQVFQMESVHAEKAVWHKNCFRCSECGKQMTVDTYASHEGRLYCVVHHRQAMKARTPAVAAAAELPAARPPAHAAPHTDGKSGSPPADVVRASNKADYGLEDLQNLNVKDRFSVFERNNDDDQDKGLTSVEVKRSQSILNKMKKFQERGQARDGADSASGDESGSEASGDEQRPARDPHVVRSTRKTKKERPMSFSGLGDVKSRFEGGGGRREPAQDEAKDELAKMRGMICGAREHKLAYEEALREQEALAESRRSVEDPSLVVQVGNLRASYERAVQEAGSPRSAAPARDSDAASGRRAADLASRFERGQPCPTEEDGEERQDGLKENGASHIAGSSSADSAVDNSLSFNGDPDVAREDASLNEPDEVTQEPAPADPELLHSDTTKRMLSKFKQMEQSTGKQDEELNTHREKAHGNARQILSKFRQMEEDAQKEDLPDGPRPLKSFTPPPEEPAASDSEDGAEDSAEEQEDPDIVRASHKVPDEFLNKRTDQARSLRDRFESWEPRPERDDKFIVEDDCKPSLEITRNLRAKFESMKEQPKPVEKPQHRASRFIMEPSQAAETCGACSKRVYAMERLEVDKRILHKNCFRCSKCNCVLRMDTYTFNAGKLFCTPHFKQMFKTKGNYDEGFGLESRTKHWSNGHADHAGHNGDASAAKRPDDALPETNGRDPERHVSNGDDPEPEPEPGQEQEREQESEEERFDAVVAETEPDVFQKVYESVVADGI